MSNWPAIPLTDIYEISSGLSKPADQFGTGFPFLSFKDVFGNYFVPSELSQLVESNKKEQARCSVIRGDVFLTRTSETMHELGMSSVALKDYPQATFNGFTKRLRQKSDSSHEVLPEYVGYYFRSPKFRQGMLAFSTMSTRASLNNEMIGRLTIDLPPIEVQTSIASILKCLDDKIKLNRQTNQTLEQIAQAIFKSWFVDFDPVRAKLAAREAFIQQHPEVTEEAIRAAAGTEGDTLAHAGAKACELAAICTISGKTEEQLNELSADTLQQLKSTAALFPDALGDSDLGDIPNGWEVKKVDSLLKRLTPKKRYTKKQVAPHGAIPVFEQGADILLGYHNEEPGFLATPTEPLFIFGDHTCVMHLSCEPFDISQNVIPLSGNEHPTLWVYYAVEGKQEFQEYRRHWSEFVIKDVVTPTKKLSMRYVEAVTDLYKRKESNISENSVLGQIRDTMLPELLSGELTTETTSNNKVSVA